MARFIYKELTFKIIGCAMKVHRLMGCGLTEACYESALQLELVKAGLKVERQKQHEVYYDDQRMGHFFTDLVVEGRVVLELKSCDDLYLCHESQLVTYLRVTGLKVGLLLNFGPSSLQYKRLII